MKWIFLFIPFDYQFRIIHQRLTIVCMYIYVFLQYDVKKLPGSFLLSLKRLNININPFFAYLHCYSSATKPVIKKVKLFKHISKVYFEDKIVQLEISYIPFHYVVRWSLVTNMSFVLIWSNYVNVLPLKSWRVNTIYNHGLHEKLISIIIKLRMRYFPKPEGWGK